MQIRHCCDLNSPLSEICSIPLATERQHVLLRLPVFARFSRRIPSSDQSPTAPKLPAPMRQRSRRCVFSDQPCQIDLRRVVYHVCLSPIFLCDLTQAVGVGTIW